MRSRYRHEYRYRGSGREPKQLVITLSQSGETLDTMEALKYAKSLGQARTLSICNVPESAIPRASRLVYYTRAGAEIGVASTKAFTTQLVALFILTATLRNCVAAWTTSRKQSIWMHCATCPAAFSTRSTWSRSSAIWAERFTPKQHAQFLGRGVHYPIALEAP